MRGKVAGPATAVTCDPRVVRFLRNIGLLIRPPAPRAVWRDFRKIEPQLRKITGRKRRHLRVAIFLFSRASYEIGRSFLKICVTIVEISSYSFRKFNKIKDRKSAVFEYLTKLKTGSAVSDFAYI